MAGLDRISRSVREQRTGSNKVSFTTLVWYRILTINLLLSNLLCSVSVLCCSPRARSEQLEITRLRRINVSRCLRFGRMGVFIIWVKLKDKRCPLKSSDTDESQSKFKSPVNGISLKCTSDKVWIGSPAHQRWQMGVYSPQLQLKTAPADPFIFNTKI